MSQERLNGQAMLGQLAMNLMDSLEKDYGEEFDINIATIVVDVTWKDGDNNTNCQINYKSTDPRRWVQEGLFNRCARIARS